MEYSVRYIRFNWIILILIYLVVVAGSFVRITGSGMGCPDWPKCFGQWVPPTKLQQLPDNYKELFLEKRAKKLKKFCKFLRSVGMEETAKRIITDPSVMTEENFNAQKTWTEYVNRLLGFLAGNAMLIGFLWAIYRYRKHKLVYLLGLNLILMGVEAWFGSIVVASNLVPWTITVHMFLALVIIAIQLYVLRRISPKQASPIPLTKIVRLLAIVVLLITFYQMFLGTQVREYIDELTKQGIGRSEWTDRLGWTFWIHRSFSWLVLVLLTVMVFLNEQGKRFPIIRWSYIILAIELISGVLLAYADMPGLVQTSHLIFASVLFGILTMLIFRMKKADI